MNLWGWKHRGLQAIKQEDNSSEATLPLNLPQKQKSIWSWLLPVSCSVLLAMSVVTFTTRWKRGITQSPINLPPRQYIFQNHPELLPFDQETSDIWQPLGIDHWWSMEWRDTDGNRLTKGIDMLHKLHCLVSVREEFTMMANDEKRSTYFNGRNAESLTRRMHIRHCFDFIRSVRDPFLPACVVRSVNWC